MKYTSTLRQRIAANKVAFGYTMVILSAIGFGSYGVWSKNIGADFGVYSQGWVRSLIILLIILPIGIATHQYKKVKRQDWKWVSVPILFGVFTQAPLYYAFNNMSIGTATLIFFSLFLITSYVFGYFFMKEKMTHAKLVSLVIAIVGLTITFGIELGVFSFLALSMAFLNGIASGGEVSSTKKTSDRYSSFQLTTLMWIGILITHLPAAFIAGERFVVPELNKVWFSMLAYAVVGLVSFWFVIEGFRHIDASIGGLLGLLEVISAIIFGVVLFNESVGPSVIIGGSLILLAAMLPDAHELWKRRQSLHR